mmetsp:Transcript_92154/g.160081  ORF Transcript_92154/g.160081 Transcript_92154/m.160081 type:complete len:548 (-) Transcript_92154:125-1768(-)
MTPPAGSWGGSCCGSRPRCNGSFMGADRSAEKEEPLSLRRLRESLSCLEQLEKQRRELRTSSDTCPFNPYGSSPSCGWSVDVDRTRLEREGNCSSSISSRPGSRAQSSSPRAFGSRLSSSPAFSSSMVLPQAAPMATVGVDMNRDGHADVFVTGVDRNRDGIPDALQRAGRSQASAAPMRVGRDSALAFALERSQERVETLQRERDEALSKAGVQEAEVLRLTVLMERSEAEHRANAEERQREREEIQRLRREHRDALEQLAAIRAEAHQSRTSSEDWRKRFDRLVEDQRHQIEALEDAGSRAARDLTEQNSRVSEFGEGLYVCLYERNALLRFIVDLLSALQSLFYDPTPFCSAAASLAQHRMKCRNAGAGSAGGAGARSRSCSCERLHRHNGCYACSHRARSSDRSIFHAREGLADLQEIVSSLENEISEASQQYTLQVQRLVDEAEQSAQALRTSDQHPPLAGDRPNDRQVLHTCLAWVDLEHQRLERQGLPPDSLAPRVDWAEERAQYHAVTRAMESKFAQLAKLKRLLQARQHPMRKRGCSG